VKLWDWALEAYARPGVQTLCLRLQDDHGQSVSYLLWAAWAAREGRAVDVGRLSEAVRLARDWEVTVARPLRAARRALKASRLDLDADGQAGLYEGLKTQELAAERLLLEALERLTRGPDGAVRDPAAALGEAAAAWGPAPADLIDALGRAFSAA
jgi:uncharacterized protein (TIGR02444 family)